MDAEEQSERTLWTVLGPTVYSITAAAMNLGFLAAAIAALYLLYGIFSGQLAGVDALPRADQTRLNGVLDIASQVLTWGLAIGTLCLALLQWGTETTGYLIGAGALVLAFGVSFAYSTFGGTGQGQALARGLLAFTQAAYVPGAIGGLLILWDVGQRFRHALQPKTVDAHQYTYGNEAEVEAPPRRVVLGKCWQGPYCRDSIRPHCPIFQAKKACWRERRGCYCEEDIVTNAAAKIQGIVLEMAPDPTRNYANAPTPGYASSMTITESGLGSVNDIRPRRVELTNAEKRERCHNCVIYNEHQREKYSVLLPIVIVGTFALCWFFAPQLKQFVLFGFDALDALLAKISFKPGVDSPKIVRPNEMAAWFVVVALAVMMVSKALQLLEWACFKAKI